MNFHSWGEPTPDDTKESIKIDAIGMMKFRFSGPTPKAPADNTTTNEIGLDVPSKLRLAAGETATPAIDPSNICERLLAEAKHDPFYPIEVTGDVIHGPNSFGPNGPLPLLFKTLLMGFSVLLLVIGWNRDVVYIYDSWANLTLVLSTAYISSSWFHTLHGSFTTLQADEISFLQKLSWALFTMVGPSEICFVVVYIAKDYLDRNEEEVVDVNQYSDDDDTQSWLTFAWVHAVATALVLVDGLIINRIPIRLLHIGVLGIYTGCHFLLSIFWLEEDVIGDHEEETKVGGIIFFLLAPLAFAIIYGLSVRSRRYAYTLNQQFDGCNGVEGYDDTDYVKV